MGLSHEKLSKFSDKSIELQEKIKIFMDEHIYPNEKNIEKEINSGDIWQPSEIIEGLKVKAKEKNLWKNTKQVVTTKADQVLKLFNLTTQLRKI